MLLKRTKHPTVETPLLDTASSNGTFERGQQVRLVVIDADTELRLGKKTFARWRAVTK